MTQKNVVMSTLFEEDFEAINDRLEDMGIDIIEKRYDLLYHRYEVYARVTIRQSYMLRRFVKKLAVSILVV